LGNGRSGESCGDKRNQGQFDGQVHGEFSPYRLSIRRLMEPLWEPNVAQLPPAAAVLSQTVSQIRRIRRFRMAFWHFGW
jgi:hypothetical protein